jgi:hypothetical protein
VRLWILLVLAGVSSGPPARALWFRPAPARTAPRRVVPSRLAPIRSLWDRPTTQRKQGRALRSVLKKVYLAAQRGEKPVVVVDIDDTAADGRMRLHAAAAAVGLPSSHLTSGADLYAGHEGADLVLRRDAFHDHYFNDPDLQKLDTPQNGVVSFLREVQRAGGRVVYVSGRRETSRAATEQHIRNLGLPFGGSEDLLLSAPNVEPATSKQLAHGKIAAMGRTIAAFDNEASSAADYHAGFPGARVFRLATFRFHDAPEDKPAKVLVLKDFSLAR